MPAESDQLGYAIVELLGEPWIVAVIRQLTAGPLRPVQLGESMAVTHSLVMERLEDLLVRGVVSRERGTGVRPAAHYALSDAGWALLSVLDVAARWERRWSSHHGQLTVPGVWALRVLGDRHTLEIILALAGGEPLCANEIQTRLRWLGRSATHQRLTDLSRAAILAREERDSRVLYSLTAGARRLGLVMMHAGRWESQHPLTHRHVSAGDLAGLLRLLAPVSSVPERLAGTCGLHVDSHRSIEPDVYLAARDGRVLALAGVAKIPTHADGHATPEAWCETLLTRRLCGVTATGDEVLLVAVLDSVSTALLN